MTRRLARITAAAALATAVLSGCGHSSGPEAIPCPGTTTEQGLVVPTDDYNAWANQWKLLKAQDAGAAARYGSFDGWLNNVHPTWRTSVAAIPARCTSTSHP